MYFSRLDLAYCAGRRIHCTGLPWKLLLSHANPQFPLSNKKQSQAVLIQHGIPWEKNCKTVPTVLMQVNKCTFPGNSDHSKQHSPQVIKTQRISSNKRWETTKRPVWFPVFPLSLSVNRLVWFVRRLRGPVMWKKLKLNNVTTWLPSTQFQANSHRACLWKTWIQFPFKCCKQLIPNS